MKKSKEILDIYNELTTSLEVSQELTKLYYKKIKKEYSSVLIEEKHKLLQKIAEGENIDLEVLKNKYLKSKELLNHSISSTSSIDNESEHLLDSTIVDGITYYYENKDKGKVYNNEYKEIGVFKNNKITLNN
jgi:hypothetical protein